MAERSEFFHPSASNSRSPIMKMVILAFALAAAFAAPATAQNFPNSYCQTCQ
jgi:hypothetical protein